MDKTIDKVAVEKHLSKDIGRAVYASVNVREHEAGLLDRFLKGTSTQWSLMANIS